MKSFFLSLTLLIVTGFTMGQETDIREYQKYKDFLTKGDAYLKAGKCNEAEMAYKEAFMIKPNDTACLRRFERLNKNKAEGTCGMTRAQREYDACIARGDQYLKDKEYASARAEFEKACSINPSDKLCKDKIEMCNVALGREEKYYAFLKNGNEAFANKKFTQARIYYIEALNYDKESKEVKDQLLKCDFELAKLDKEKQYTDLHIAAKNSYQEKKYETALTNYIQMCTIKPGDTTCDNGITRCNKAILQRKNYNDAVKKADGFYSRRQFKGAKLTYQEALHIDPNQEYPKVRITDCDKALADEERARKTEASYTEAMKKGDDAFVGKRYEDAKKYYQEASAIKPASSDPKAKLVEIQKLVGK